MGRTGRSLGGILPGRLAFLFLEVAVAALLLAGCTGKGKPKAETEQAPSPGLPIPSERWTGDLNGMIERRQIRALVVYSRSAFFFDAGQPRGIAFEALRELETFVNQKFNTGALKVQVTFLPTPYEDLEKSLLEGKGDLIALGVGVTPERQKRVDFTLPLASGVTQIVVTGAGGPTLNSIDDLGGKEVYVNPFTVQYELLKKLNDSLQQQGKPQIKLKATDPNLGEEDLLEMANAGLIKITVGDSLRAEFWSKVFNHISLHPNLTLGGQEDLAWVLRKNSPKFKAVLDEFVEGHRVGTSFGNTVLRRYLQNTKWVKNPTSEAEMQKFRAYVKLFKKYGNEYDFDYLMLMAQGYQESMLNQNLRSRRGAVGVMQVMPKSAAASPINITNVSTPDNNIRAGAKMLRSIQDVYLTGNIDPLNKTLLAFAAYNAGPTRISRLRKQASAEGLDPDKWFGNVELVVAKEVGQETVHYVGNIYKYYVAYKLATEESQLTEKAKAAFRK